MATVTDAPLDKKVEMSNWEKVRISSTRRLANLLGSNSRFC